MSASARNALISLARESVSQSLYGDIDYYMDKAADRGVLLKKMCSFIEDNEREWDMRLAAKDAEIVALKKQNGNLVDRIVNGRSSSQNKP